MKVREAIILDKTGKAIATQLERIANSMPEPSSDDSGGGITDAAKGYILALFENAVYKNDTMQATYNALRKEWGPAPPSQQGENR